MAERDPRTARASSRRRILKLLEAATPVESAQISFGPPFDQTVGDAVCRDDRDWFRAIPLESERYRLAVTGEAPGLLPLPTGWVWAVRVTNLGDGSGLREFRSVRTEGTP